MNATQDKDSRASGQGGSAQFSASALEQLIPGQVTPAEHGQFGVVPC